MITVHWKILIFENDPFGFIFSKICLVNLRVFTTNYQPSDIFVVSEYLKFPKISCYAVVLMWLHNVYFYRALGNGSYTIERIM